MASGIRPRGPRSEDLAMRQSLHLAIVLYSVLGNRPLCSRVLVEVRGSLEKSVLIAPPMCVPPA
eukprot:COSAG06_NODE_3856_length_4827_cov_10.381557_8_plen_64_part_00